MSKSDCGAVSEGSVERQFPLLGAIQGFRSMPWALLAKTEKRAVDNHGLTLEQIARKCGGLTYDEALHVVEDRDLPRLFKRDPQAAVRLMAHVERWRREQKNASSADPTPGVSGTR